MKPFFPFPFRNAEDRIRLFAVVHDMRESNRPVPEVPGKLLLSATDDELRCYVREIREFCGEDGQRVGEELRHKAVCALDILGYFHGLTCRSGDAGCLGREIEELLIDFTE